MSILDGLWGRLLSIGTRREIAQRVADVVAGATGRPIAYGCDTSPELIQAGYVQIQLTIPVGGPLHVLAKPDPEPSPAASLATRDAELETHRTQWVKEIDEAKTDGDVRQANSRWGELHLATMLRHGSQTLRVH